MNNRTSERFIQLTWLVMALLLCLQPAEHAHGFSTQGQSEVTQLEPGRSVEREIAGGESHTYQISLAAGQFVRVVAEQKEIDVKLALATPDGKQLVEMNLTRAGGLESLSEEAAASGDYRLTIRADGAATLAGSYQVRLETRAAATAQDRQRIAAERLMREAKDLRTQGRKTAEPAIDKLQQALAVWRELNESTWVAWSLSNIGGANSSLGRYEKALEYDEQALAIYRELKNRAGEGNSLNDLGGVYYRLSRYEKAIEYHEQALVISREVKDRAGEGIALNNLGIANYGMSRYEKAIEYHEQALVISREVNDWDSEARALNSLGIAYRKLGRYEKAIEYFEQALVIHRREKDRAGEGVVLNNISGAYANLNRYEKAIEYLEQGLAIYRELKNRNFEGIALSNLGYFYENMNRYEKAIGYLEQALTIDREVKNRNGEGVTLHNLGDAYYNLKRYDKAIEYLAQALAIHREVKDRDGETYILYSLARAERDTDNLPAARARIEDGLKITESLRSDIFSPESRASFLANVQNSYQLYTDLLMRQHRAEPTKGFDALAVEVSERQRARSLLDLLTESGTDLRQGIAPALIEREETLAKELNDKAQALTQAPKPEQIAALKREISQLEIDYERAQTAIRKASPHYAALTQPQPLKLTEIQAQLDADTLLLEYALGEERSYLWAITKDSLTSYELPKGKLIEKNARQVYELLTARSTNQRGETPPQRRERIAQAEAKLPAAAQELSRTLLTPVAAQLGNKRLVIVADGALQYIPFAMLPSPVVGRNQPLIVGHEVVSLPSASALAIQRAELAGRQPAPKMLAVIADPVFDRTDERFKTAAPEANDKAQTQTIAFADARNIEHLAEKSDNKSGITTRTLVIPRLPFTRQEANQLMALTSKTSSFRAMGFQASRATVLDPTLGQYRYVHFATHGLLDSERPGLSSLVLSMVDAQGKPQDGFLRANDIYNLKLPAELVVLSACQTGLGKDVKGEGLIGLTRGFMYAGAARVVVSLWSVNDKATADLMTKFYQKMLKQGERPAAALRAAQVEMWKQKQWQSPYYWAAFTLQGEWR
ncbi:MAG: CHAT domain-containing protein [Pyrinomonadaceae bacterium]|nr:CHAT domain-containing protein [Pyrinomonadaceae bacterium]